MINYILDDDRNPVPEPDFLKFAEWRSKNSCVVAKMIMPTEFARLEVSTVFLSISHGNSAVTGEPILFETAIFNLSTGKLHEVVGRSCTWDEAQKLHNETVKGLEGR